MIAVRILVAGSLAGLSLLAVMVAAGGGGDLTVTRYTVDGGGVMFGFGGDFELSGTIGQPDAGRMTGGEYDLTGGFWFPLAPGDCNSDGGVNLFDQDDLVSCVTGPDSGVIAGCQCFDLDHNGAVDLADFAVVQRTFTGR